MQLSYSIIQPNFRCGTTIEELFALSGTSGKSTLHLVQVPYWWKISLGNGLAEEQRDCRIYSTLETDLQTRDHHI